VVERPLFSEKTNAGTRSATDAGNSTFLRTADASERI